MDNDARATVEPRSVTLSDVARKAGVSISTASRVVNETGVVSEAKRERVLAVVQEMGYVANSLARSFRLGETRTIGVLVPEATDPYFMQVIRGVEDVLVPEGYALLIASSHHRPDLEVRYCQMLAERRMDGAILVLISQTLPSLDRWFAASTPIVLADTLAHDAIHDCVLDDNRHGINLLVDLLSDYGHQTIGLVVGSPDIIAGREREQAFRERCARLSIHPMVWRGDYSEEFGESVADEVAQSEATAIIGANSQISVGLLTGLKRRNITIPEALSFASYGDVANAELLTVPPCVVRQPAVQTGREAANRFLHHTRDASYKKQSVVLRLRPELVMRSSVGPPARSPIPPR